jgi:hypothetical protein
VEDRKAAETQAVVDYQANEEASMEAVRRDIRITKMKADMKKKARDAEIQYAADVMQASANGLQATQILFGKNKKLAKAEAVARGGVAIMNALSVQPWFLGLSQAVLAGAMTKQTIDSIDAAKYARGGDFVTDGPQMIMVGDNAGGKERVQVTPMSSPNYDGPRGNDGGRGITINATIYNTGSTARDEAWTDRELRRIADGVRQAVRQGYNLGIS